MALRTLSCLAIGLVAATAQAAQTAPDPVAIPAEAGAIADGPAEGYLRIPANTAINFEIVDALSSKTSRIDQMFAIRIADPVMIDGRVVLPAGTPGEGQVVHAAKARAMGKAGEMILAARYFQCGDTRVPLRGFRFGQQGTDKSGQAIIASALVLPLGFFITGGEMTVPAGARANARLSKPVDIRVASVADCAVATPASVTTPTPADNK